MNVEDSVNIMVGHNMTGNMSVTMIWSWRLNN